MFKYKYVYVIMFEYFFLFLTCVRMSTFNKRNEILTNAYWQVIINEYRIIFNY